MRDAGVDIFPVYRAAERERDIEIRAIEGYSSWRNRRAGMLII